MQKAEAQRDHSKTLMPLEPRGQFSCKNQVSKSRGGTKGCEGQKSTPHNGWQTEDLGVGDLGEHK